MSWVNTNDFGAQWEDEPACAQFSYEQNVDKFKGTCDLAVKGGVTGASACCKKCSDDRACVAFTYFSGQCFLKSCKTSSRGSVSLSGAVSAVKK